MLFKTTVFSPIGSRSENQWLEASRDSKELLLVGKRKGHMEKNMRQVPRNSNHELPANKEMGPQSHSYTKPDSSTRNLEDFSSETPKKAHVGQHLSFN